MRNQTILLGLIGIMVVLAAVAAGAGLFYETPGAARTFTSHRGETVTLTGHGLYANDTASMAAQMRGNDVVTLGLAIPMLLISAIWAARGSVRGRLLLSGTIGFFLYTYMSMAFLASYNSLFLVYVALYSTSLVAFLLSLATVDLASLPAYFSDRLPRGWIAGIMFGGAGFLALAWLGRIIPPLAQGALPALENTTTLVIQAMDLGMIVPLSVISGTLLLRRSAWGYLLASVAILKFVTLGAAVCTMMVNMLRAGVPVSAAELGIFPTITIANLFLAGLLLYHVKERPGGS